LFPASRMETEARMAPWWLDLFGMCILEYSYIISLEKWLTDVID